jgi:hypothetical protein
VLPHGQKLLTALRSCASHGAVTSRTWMKRTSLMTHKFGCPRAWGLRSAKTRPHQPNGCSQFVDSQEHAVRVKGHKCAVRRDGVPRRRPLPWGLSIADAYWFTSSASFANPAVALERSLTDTFVGIRPFDAGGFIVAQFGGVADDGPVPLARSLVAESRRRGGCSPCGGNGGRTRQIRSVY